MSQGAVRTTLKTPTQSPQPIPCTIRHGYDTPPSISSSILTPHIPFLPPYSIRIIWFWVKNRPSTPHNFLFIYKFSFPFFNHNHLSDSLIRKSMIPCELFNKMSHLHQHPNNITIHFKFVLLRKNNFIILKKTTKKKTYYLFSFSIRIC